MLSSRVRTYFLGLSDLEAVSVSLPDLLQYGLTIYNALDVRQYIFSCRSTVNLAKQREAGDGEQIKGRVSINFNSSIGAWRVLVQLLKASRFGTYKLLTTRPSYTLKFVSGARGRKMPEVLTEQTNFFGRSTVLWIKDLFRILDEQSEFGELRCQSVDIVLSLSMTYARTMSNLFWS